MEQHHKQNFATHKLRTGGRRKGFLRSEDGSLIIFGLILFVLMLTVAGLSVDFMRAETHRARLQSTLDRAVLAAGSMQQTLDPKDVVLDYFDKAGLGDFIDPDDITVTESLTSRRVEASARLNVGTTFLRLSGIDRLPAPAMGAAEENASQTEVSLVLDVSGSMGSSSASGHTKIYELRKAAKQFVNLMLCDPARPNATTGCTVEPGKVSLTVVPYSEQVLVGEDLLSHFAVTNEHTYSSCVTFRADDFDRMGITPTEQLLRTGHIDPWSNDDEAGPNWARTCRTDSWREITPVNGDIPSLHNAIGALQSGGNTSIDVGMKWGSAFLEPQAQPVIGELVTEGTVANDFANRPLAWTVPNIKKVIVLMTDGVNTGQHYLYDNRRSGPSPVFYYDCVDGDPCKAAGHDRIYSVYKASTDQYKWYEVDNQWHDHPYGDLPTESAANTGAVQFDYADLWNDRSWEWWDSFEWLGDAGSYHGTSVKNDRLQAICSAAKAKGVTVFTVGFEVTSWSADVMRQCASTPSHYFNANGSNLADKFAAIARKISELRLIN